MSEQKPVRFRGKIKNGPWEKDGGAAMAEKIGRLMEVAQWADLMIKENGACVVEINRIDNETENVTEKKAEVAGA
jgi:hypothetical protein